MGISSALRPEPRPEDFFGSTLLSLLITLLCFVEAKLHIKPIPPLSGWVVLTTWPVSVPVCLFRLHGVRGSGRIALFLLSLFAASVAGAVLIRALSG